MIGLWTRVVFWQTEQVVGQDVGDGDLTGIAVAEIRAMLVS